MVTGTFTDGGAAVDYSSFVSTVYAAGGHLTSLQTTGVEIDSGPGYALSHPAPITVKTVDARLHLAAGQSIYKSDGTHLGTVTAVTNATTITVGGGLLAAVADDDPLFVVGANKPSVTLVSTSLDVSIDETNNLVIFESGNRSATSLVSATDGRWWILGTR
jgi:hypothetical protein